MLVVYSKKYIYNAKVKDIENKYVTTADYNKFNKDIVANSIKSKGIVDIAGFINNAELDKKVAT